MGRTSGSLTVSMARDFAHARPTMGIFISGIDSPRLRVTVQAECAHGRGVAASSTDLGVLR